MNKVILCGRLTRDPESRMTQASLEVSRFSLACSSDFVNKDGQRETEFINCVAFGRTAQTINKFCTKGRMILAQGRIRNSSYDAQDGTKRYTTDVVVENFEFVSGGNNARNNEEQTNYQQNNSYANNYSTNSSIQTTDINEDPYKEFSEETNISSDEFPF